jgi:ppGpp synthetase/RelA/SpoT-type nucleotidyltranferase
VGVIDDFISEYERQFDFWEASARTARGLLETELASSGLRAIVTSRAKSVDRLIEKLHARDRETPYKSVAEIGPDIVDRAGVRVALYFPGQMDEVEQVIRTTLEVQKDKHFPSKRDSDDRKAGAHEPDMASGGDAQTVPAASAHRQRFSGYGARHFRVNIPESRLSAGQERYASALVEVQVASVLMHAWSEVEHDLVYKPLEGELSSSEYALLDQLNGLVLAGEIALEQLQQAGDARLTVAETPFRNHYELAEFLRTRLSALGTDLTDATLGRIDVLFDYLAERSSATASSVRKYLDLLEKDFERRPVAAQLADLMLSGDESRYKAYLSAMVASRHPSNRRRTTAEDLKARSPEKLALGEFVTAWVLLETLLKEFADSEDERLPALPTLFRRLRERGLISPEQYTELDSMRQLRNRVFHGRVGEFSPELLREAAALLRDLTKAIEHKAGGS